MNANSLSLEDLLIDISEDDMYESNDSLSHSSSDENNQANSEDDSETNDDITYLVHNNHPTSDDPTISEFLQFCINNGLFDNTFYDTQNVFSVVATKLPKTFEKLSSGKNDIKKRSFVTKFKKEFGYNGDINFIYNCLDPGKKGFITWDEFVDFFLPFVQYITV